MSIIWKYCEVSDWGDFTHSVDQFVEPRPNEVNRFIFRGQANAEWLLEPSFYRACNTYSIDEQVAIKIEQKATREFIEQAHIHFDPSSLPAEDNYLEWWQIMQHYNAPTRLLDWTKSVYVAAYFAVEREFSKPGAIWIVEPGAILDRMRDLQQRAKIEFKLYSLAQDPKQISFHRPKRPSNRMIAQQGWFSVATHIFADHSEIIAESVKNHVERHWIFKLIIPADLKMDFLRRLRTMNITAGSLFPGADGLGRSVAELIYLKDWID